MNENTIDRKFKISAVNPVNGKRYTEEDGFFMCAKDKAVLPALRAYVQACLELRANREHIKSINLMIKRVEEYQANVECRVPDTVGKEIERCIDGIDRTSIEPEVPDFMVDKVMWLAHGKDNAAKHCPRCGDGINPSTYVDRIARDENPVRCDCGWIGKAYELV